MDNNLFIVSGDVGGLPFDASSPDERALNLRYNRDFTTLQLFQVLMMTVLPSVHT